MRKRGVFFIVAVLFFLAISLKTNAQYCCFDPADLSTFCLLFPDTTSCPTAFINVTGLNITSCDSPLVPECQLGCCICTNGTTHFLHPDKVTRRYLCDQYCSAFTGFNATFNESIRDATICQQQITKLANISGTVVNAITGTPIPSASISIDGLSTKTDASGKYRFENLLARTYSIVASAQNYETKNFIQTLSPGENTFNIQLTPLPTVTLSGFVKDEKGNPIQQAEITATAKSQYKTKTDTKGYYTIQLVPDTYSIEAFYPGFELQTKTIKITNNTQINFTLKKEPTANVSGYVIDSITAQHIPLAELTFIRTDKLVIIKTRTTATGFSAELPVKSTGRTEYKIKVEKPSYQPAQETVFLLPNDVITKDILLTPFGANCSYFTLTKPQQFTANHIRGVKAVLLTWQKPCETVLGYRIFRELFEIATISDPNQLQFIDKDVDWNTKYTYSIKAIYPNGESDPATATIKTGSAECEGKTTEFCIGKSRYECTEQNQLSEIEACSVACFGPDAFGITYCIDPGECNSSTLGADPFGLYFNANLCHAKQFCYYDKFNFLYKCQSCNNIHSCFDYKSELACQKDACGFGKCKWLPIVPELGLGICTQLGYEKEDKCDLCNQPFLASECTPSQCQLLGKCRYDQTTKSCLKCTAGITCYDYTDEQSCDTTLLNPTTNQITPSKDHCRLGTCRWTGTKCIKDGNADYIDDCSPTDLTCKADNKRPETKVNTIKVTATNPIISFESEPESTIFYCISPSAQCTPSNQIKTDSTGKASVDVTKLSFPASPNNKYFVSFYAIDKHKNRELNIKTKEIYIDTKPPSLQIITDVAFPTPTNATAYITILSDEIVFCTDNLKGLQDQRIDYSTTIIYPDLAPKIYPYEITCKDLVGNTAKASAQIDAQDPYIIQLLPKRVTKERTITVQVKTAAKANCSLYRNNTFIEKFSTTDNIIHTSTSTFSYTRSGLYMPFTVKCTDLATKQQKQRNIFFTLDFEPPKTILLLETTSTSFTATTPENWPSFTESVTVKAQCRDAPATGFGCKEILYCLTDLGKKCSPSTQFTDQLPIHSSTTFCYKSIDNGDNEESTNCGIIAINKPLGISLVYPPNGVSTKPAFTLKIKTDKPAMECKYASTSFSYDSGTPFKKDSPTEFHIENFPRSVWYGQQFEPTDGANYPQKTQPYETYLLNVQCKEPDGTISKEHAFLIRYDPTPPEILRAYVSETPWGSEQRAITTNAVFNVETDDETICKYSLYTKQFDSMRSGFPDWHIGLYKTNHTVSIPTTQLKDRTTYTYYVVCRNLAGLDSAPVTLTFTVDKKRQGVIISAKPIVNKTTVTLNVETNLPANCKYIDELNASYDFPQSNTQVFSATFDKPKEGKYPYKVSCTFIVSGLTQTIPVDIVIDLTPPKIIAIQLAEKTCDRTQIHPTFVAEDPDNLSAIVLYEWQITNTNYSVNGTSSQNSPLIDGLLLNVDEEYTLKVRCKDAAGHYSDWSSITFTVLNSTAPECRERGPPNITIIETPVPNGKNVEILCQDENGCNGIYYGLSKTTQDCTPTLQYAGTIFLSETSVLCYSAADTVGNQINGSKRIIVEVIKIQDSDLDGIPDAEDKCPNTPSDKVTEVEINKSSPHYGCAPDEIDSDADGMPDYWELKYNLNPNDPSDASLDPDNDGYTNLEEYRKGTDPTVLNDADLDTIPDKFDKCPNTPPSEVPYIIKNPASPHYGCSKAEIPRRPILGKIILIILIIAIIAAAILLILKYKTQIFAFFTRFKKPKIPPPVYRPVTIPKPREVSPLEKLRRELAEKRKREIEKEKSRFLERLLPKKLKKEEFKQLAELIEKRIKSGKPIREIIKKEKLTEDEFKLLSDLIKKKFKEKTLRKKALEDLKELIE